MRTRRENTPRVPAVYAVCIHRRLETIYPSILAAVLILIDLILYFLNATDESRPLLILVEIRLKYSGRCPHPVLLNCERCSVLLLRSGDYNDDYSAFHSTDSN